MKFWGFFLQFFKAIYNSVDIMFIKTKVKIRKRMQANVMNCYEETAAKTTYLENSAFSFDGQK